MRVHVDEAGHDDGVPVVDERPPEREAPVVPDGDGVDEPSLHLHCGGADPAERDDPLAGDPEVAVREQAAPFAAQTPRFEI